MKLRLDLAARRRPSRRRLSAATRVAAALLLGALLFGGTSAHALLFQEAIGNNGLDIFPDQPGDPFNFVGENDGTLTLDPGLNEMAGFFSCFGSGCTDDFDSFRMIVPEDLQIVRTTFTVVNVDGTSEMLDIYPTGVFTTPPRFDEDWRSTYRPIEVRLFSGIGSGPGTSTTVLGPGTYDVVPFNFNWIGGGGWRVQFETAVVPEPGTSLLLGLGLLGLAANRPRRSVWAPTSAMAR